MDSKTLPTKEYLDVIEKSKRKIDRILKNCFAGQIKINFMLSILYAMLNLYPELGQYLRTPNDMEAVLSGRTQNLLYILCEHIVGVHRSKIIFLSDEKRSQLENDCDYRSELMADVCKEVKLRPHIDAFIRNCQIIKGDKFLLFPVPFYLAVLEIKFLELSSKSKKMPFIYSNIANKSLATLSLLQDNLADCSYSACRTIIEDYLKGTVFYNCKEAMEEYYKFADYELKQSICYSPDQEFLNKFNNRKNKRCSKTDYLHYGWVDVIPHYHEMIKNYPYTFGGIKNFVVQKFANDESKKQFELLDYYHNMCHGFVHGSICNSKYPIIHYFDICSILVNTLTNAYFALCEELGEEKAINDIDIIDEINKHYRILKEIESKKNTENFENYYKKFNVY